jgi:hypothetical protein
VKSHEPLPRTPSAPPSAAPCPSSSTAPSVVQRESVVALRIARDTGEPAAADPGTTPLLRAFVARYGATYGLTEERIAQQLHLPPGALAAYTDTGCPPRWLVLALAGVGTAHGIPRAELAWLLESLRS